MQTDTNFTRCDVCGVVVAESLADCWNCRRNMAQARSEALTRVWQGKDVPKVNQPLTLREQAAIAAMQGFCSNPKFSEILTKTIAEWSVDHADQLVAELNGEVEV